MVLLRSIASAVLVLAVSSSSLLGACAHRPLAAGELERVQRPALVARVDEGPQVRLSGAEDDLEAALSKALRTRVGPFEVAERLRASTVERLPDRRPWSQTLPPAQVAGALQSFLVEEARREPDYAPLRDLGADGVVELVIESYGLHGRGAESGVFLLGYGRLITLDGRQLWRRNFRADGLESKLPPLDAAQVAQDPDLFRQSMNRLLEGVAAQFAKDLTPAE